MNISSPAIERPVATTLLTLALLLAGALAYTQLPVSPLPQVDFPVIGVSASLPGASPETMASAVATPLERQFGRIAGINQMTSVSQLGSTGITMQFDLDRNIDAAARDVQAAINAARNYLPPNLPNNPYYRKVNPADAPILILALTSDAFTQDQMYDAADSIMGQKLAQIEGVGQVFVGGSSQPAVRIEANPFALNNMGLGLETVRTAVAAENANQAKGTLQSDGKSWMITANDQLKKAKDYRSLIVAYKNGNPVRLSDVADVQDSYSNINNMGSFDGKPSVLVVIFRQPGANIIATVDRVIAALPFLKASLPAAIDMVVGLDRTTTVRASVADVQRTLIISVILVVLVVFVFLREVRATLIPSVAVPLAIVGTFGIMYVFGYSLDNLSLMALTISTGFVVDDAIVVLENVMRHVEEGMKPYQAALLGAREIGFTVVSMSTSLMAVFIPILLMGGLIGRLFHEFAVTLSAAIAVSLMVSLTTTPMLCARFLKAHDPGSHGSLYRMSERGFYWLNRGYKSSLGWVLRHRRLIFAGTILMVFVNVGLYIIVPKGFFPQQDTGRLAGTIMGDQDVSFPAMKAKTNEFIRIVRKDPAVQDVLAFVGGNTAQNQGRMYVILKPESERKATADQVIARLRPKLSHVPGATLYFQAVQDLQIGGRLANAQYQYTLSGENLDELYEWAPKLLEKLRAIPQLKDVNSDQQVHGLEANVVIDRHTAARLGVTPQQIDAVLYDAFGQEQDLDHLPDPESVSRGDGSRSQVPAHARRVEERLRDHQHRSAGAAVDFRALCPGQYRARGQPPGTVSGGHAFLQPGARRRPGNSNAFDQPDRVGTAHAGYDSRQLSGNRGRLPGFTLLGAHPDSGRAGRRIYRAGDFVRKLYSPHYDSVDLALGRHRSIAGAAAVPSATRRHRLDRNYSADRYRQEERHHHDRLRAGSGAHRQVG